MGMSLGDLDTRTVEAWIKVEDKITPIYSVPSLGRKFNKDSTLPRQARPHDHHLDTEDVIRLMSSDVKSIESDVFQMKLDLQVVLQYLRQQQEDNQRLSEKRKPPPNHSLIPKGASPKTTSEKETLSQWLGSRRARKAQRDKLLKQNKTKERNIPRVCGSTIVCDPETPSLSVQSSPSRANKNGASEVVENKLKDASRNIETTTGGQQKIVFKNQAKLFIFVEHGWREQGVGNIKIIQDDQSSIRLVMESSPMTSSDTYSREQKIYVNHKIEPHMQVSFKPQKNKKNAVTWKAVNVVEETTGRLEHFCCRFTTPEIATEFKKAFESAKDIVTSGSNIGKPSAPEFEDKRESVPRSQNRTFTTSTEISAATEHPTQASVSDENDRSTRSFTFTPIPDTATSRSGFFRGKTVEQSLHDNGCHVKEIEDNEEDDFEPDVYFKPVVTLSTKVDLKTGEEDEEKLFGHRAKLYWNDPEIMQWKERGTGEIKILKNVKTGAFRILMRREQVHKTCANHRLTKDMKLVPHQTSENAWCWFTYDFSEDAIKAQQFAVRFQQKDQAKKFKEVFEECVLKITKEGVKGGGTTSNLTETQPESLPLGNQFMYSDWECGVCYVRNNAGSRKCVACETLKPDITQADERGARLAMDVEKANVGSSRGFTFGGPPVADLISSKKPAIFQAQKSVATLSSTRDSSTSIDEHTKNKESIGERIPSLSPSDRAKDDSAMTLNQKEPDDDDAISDIVKVSPGETPDSIHITTHVRESEAGTYQGHSHVLDGEASQPAAYGGSSIEEDGTTTPNDTVNVKTDLTLHANEEWQKMRPLDEMAVLFSEHAKLSHLNEDDDYTHLGDGELRVVQDTSTSGARIQMTSHVGDTLCDHVISRKFYVKLFEAGNICEWTAQDALSCSRFADSTPQMFRAKFSSLDAAQKYREAFDKGVVWANETKLFGARI